MIAARRPPPALVAAVAALAGSGCTLLFGVDGISDGPARDAGAGDVSVGDAAADVSRDVTADAAQALDPDLVGWWTFDEGQGAIAHDGSGQKNDGSLNGGASWAPGKSGTALAFDGVAGRVLVPDSPSLRSISSELTVAMWLYVRSNANQNRVVQAGSAWLVKINGTNPELATQQRFAITAWSTPFGEWHHLAFAFKSGAALSAYVDGAPTSLPSNQFPTASLIPVDTEGLGIGGVVATAPDGISCDCLLDDVRIYRRALSATEIGVLAK